MAEKARQGDTTTTRAKHNNNNLTNDMVGLCLENEEYRNYDKHVFLEISAKNGTLPVVLLLTTTVDKTTVSGSNNVRVHSSTVNWSTPVLEQSSTMLTNACPCP